MYKGTQQLPAIASIGNLGRPSVPLDWNLSGL